MCGLEVGDYFGRPNPAGCASPRGGTSACTRCNRLSCCRRQRLLEAGDWLEQDNLVACPDPDERLIMKIERIARRTLATDDLT